MKRLLAVIFFAASYSVAAQNTWVQKLSYSYQTWGYIDTLTGVKKIEIGRDGSVYVLANVNDLYTQYIYKFSPNSNHMEWKIGLGSGGAGAVEWTDNFRATSDSGIIICQNLEDGFSVGGHLVKY